MDFGGIRVSHTKEQSRLLLHKGSGPVSHFLAMIAEGFRIDKPYINCKRLACFYFFLLNISIALIHCQFVCESNSLFYRGTFSRGRYVVVDGDPSLELFLRLGRKLPRYKKTSERCNAKELYSSSLTLCTHFLGLSDQCQLVQLSCPVHFTTRTDNLLDWTDVLRLTLKALSLDSTVTLFLLGLECLSNPTFLVASHSLFHPLDLPLVETIELHEIWLRLHLSMD